MSEDEPIRVGIAKQTWSRELRAMGYRKLSPPASSCPSRRRH
jgi:hypothetical protein